MKRLLLPLLFLVGVHSYNVGPFSSSWISEAEKKHARTAMLAVPTLLSLGTITDHPVQWLNSQPVETQVSVYAAAAVLESVNLARHDYGFALKEGESPGNVLGRNPTTELSAIEDGVGRMAMLGATALLIQAI
jgi:hypothetical protein